jgi:hypothetical protein
MSRKIIEYKIINVHADEVNKILHLQHLVNEQVVEGWQPKGCLVVDSEGTIYQTVVKYEQ